MVGTDERGSEMTVGQRRRIPGVPGDLVVRDELVGDVTQTLVASPGLVTLVGVGGTGKTFAAATIARAWPGAAGAAWVDLQRARSIADLDREVAWSLGLGRGANLAALEAELVQHDDLLLVLDNLEQLPRGVADRIEAWLDAARSLRILGTSRRRTGVAAERPFELAPLPVPSVDDVLESPVWQLLGSWAPPGSLAEVSAPVARALLAELEGLPLALRLAAGRLEVFDPGTLAQRVGQGRGLLADPESPDARHGSLASAFAWSFDPLDREAKAALCRLSVFRGPFGIDDAEAVLDMPRAVDLVQLLRARHLLSREEHEGEARFRMLEAIREFAGRALQGTDRRTAFERHAIWCLQPFSAPAPVREADWDELVRRVPELLGVLDRAQHDVADLQLSLRCANAACFALARQGRPRDTWEVADRGLALIPPSDPHPVSRGRLLVWRAEARRLCGDVDGAFDDLVTGMQIASDTGDAELELAATEGLAHAYEERRQLSDAEQQLTRLLEHPACVPMTRQAIRARALLATIRAERADFPGPDDPRHAAYLAMARQAADQARALDLVTQLDVLKSLGWLQLELDHLHEARDSYTRAHAIALRLGDRRAAGAVSGQLGMLAEFAGDLDAAVQLYDEAVLRFRQVGNASMASNYLGFQGRALARIGDLAAARSALRAALEPSEVGRAPFVEQFGIALSLLDAREGRPDTSLPDDTKAAGWTVPLVRDGFDALRTGDREAAAEALATLRARLDDLGTGLRELVARLCDELAEPLTQWRFDPGGTWFEPPHAARVRLDHRPTPGRVLAHLVARRRDAPGEPSDTDALFAAGWPDEQATAASAANRVRVALSNLRKAGLAPVLERREDGWRLAPDVPMSWDPDPRVATEPGH